MEIRGDGTTTTRVGSCCIARTPSWMRNIVWEYKFERETGGWVRGYLEQKL
jgi:hypothetical protein